MVRRYADLVRGGWNAGSSGDHVRVMTAVIPVPEPGTYALMLGGLGVVGFARPDPLCDRHKSRPKAAFSMVRPRR